MGGYGTDDLGIHVPGYFAAYFSIYGMANKKQYLANASNLPIWIFHGAKDNVGDVQPNRDIYKTLKAN